VESPTGIECAHLIIDRMRDNAKAFDLLGGSERRAQSEQEERARMALALITPVDRKWPSSVTGTGSGLLRCCDFGMKARSI
jgi:hypothetical protein